MKKIKKIGIILILIGLCLPTATLPFITEFHPVQNLCLTSNFFQNMGNMKIALSSRTSIPYRYIFSLGVVLTFAGIGAITLLVDNKKIVRQDA